MRVPILMYHQLVPEDAAQGTEGQEPYSLPESIFREQMDYLSSNGYTAISLGDFIAYVNGEAIPPLKPAVITFDDGSGRDYEIAYPILTDYGLRATFFVVTSRIGCQDELKWEQIREMRSSGMDIHSHTHTHPYLTQLSQEQIETELSQSRLILEGWIGSPVCFLSIPGGIYNGVAKRIAKETGYLAVVTSDLGVNVINSDLYALKRIAVRRRVTLSQFALYLEGRGMFREKLRQFAMNAAKRILGIRTYVSLRAKLLRLKQYQEETA